MKGIFQVFGKIIKIKNVFMRKLRADISQIMVAVIRCRIFGLTVFYQKIQRLRY
jgi:hypothetical protein